MFVSFNTDVTDHCAAVFWMSGQAIDPPDFFSVGLIDPVRLISKKAQDTSQRQP